MQDAVFLSNLFPPVELAGYYRESLRGLKRLTRALIDRSFR